VGYASSGLSEPEDFCRAKITDKKVDQEMVKLNER
jgi:hypothetical protein